MRNKVYIIVKLLKNVATYLRGCTSYSCHCSVISMGF